MVCSFRYKKALFVGTILAFSMGVQAEQPKINQEICPKEKDLPGTINVPVSDVMAGQPYVSFETTERIANGPDRMHRGYILEDDKVKYCFNGGQSAFNKEFLVVKVPKKLGKSYMLVDGHNTVAGILKGVRKNGGDPSSTTIPVKIKDDLSKLSVAEFWVKAKKQNYVYTGDSYKIKINTIDKIPENDKNDIRAFLEKTLIGCSEVRKIEYKNDPSKIVWLRVGGDNKYTTPDFTEFRITEVLENASFSYKPSSEITSEMVANARSILDKNSKTLKKVLLIQESAGKLIVKGENMSPEDYCLRIKDPESFSRKPSEKSNVKDKVKAIEALNKAVGEKQIPQKEKAPEAVAEAMGKVTESNKTNEKAADKTITGAMGKFKK